MVNKTGIEGKKFSRIMGIAVFYAGFFAITPAFSAKIDPILQKYNLTAEHIEPLEIKFGTLAPTGTPWIDFVYEKLIPYVNAESRGKIKIVLYAGGVMGEDTDILRKMKLGQLQGCGCTVLGVLLSSPEVSVLSLPMLFNNYKEVDYILETFRDDIDKMFDKRGYYLAGLIDTGFFYLFAKNEIKALDDLKKQKVLTWFGEVETTTLDELGVKPISVTVPEVVTSLQTGLINADIAPPIWQMGTQAYTQTNYYVTQPFIYSIAAIILDKANIEKIAAKYPKGLGDDMVKLATSLIRDLEGEWRNRIRDYEEKSLRAFENSGMRPVTLSSEDLANLQNVAPRVWKRLEGKLYSKELLNKILSALEQYRSKK